MVAVMIIGVTLFNLCPLYHNYKIGAFSGNRVPNSTLDFAVYFTFPGMDPTHWFLSITIFNLLGTHVCTILFVGIDLLLYMMVFQIIGHIQILRNNLHSLPKPKKIVIIERRYNQQEPKALYEIYDAEENRYIHMKLIECIDHHRMIVSFTDQFSDFFGLMLAMNYMFHLFSCCLLLLECSKGVSNSIIYKS